MRRQIGNRIRRLRADRQWSQHELARRLRIAQSRLSGIENGSRSLTAEELIEVLTIFNVPVTELVHPPPAAGSQIQNALERLGATHLRENPDVLPSELVSEASDVIREVLIAAESPRHLTALAPVLVRHVDRVDFQRLRTDIPRARLGWIVENTVEAARRELKRPLARRWRVGYQRAIVILEDVLAQLRARPRRFSRVDILDADVRSAKTRQQLEQQASAISRRWNVVTAIQVEDFVTALRESRVAG